MVVGWGVHSHYIVKPNLMMTLGWGFDNTLKQAVAELGQAQLQLGLGCTSMINKKYMARSLVSLRPLRRPTFTCQCGLGWLYSDYMANLSFS